MTPDGLSARELGLDAWGRLRAQSDRCGFAEAGRRARPDRRCRSVWRVCNSLLDGFQVLVERFRIALFDAVLNHREPIGLEIPRTSVAVERGQLLVDMGPSHQVVEVASSTTPLPSLEVVVDPLAELRSRERRTGVLEFGSHGALKRSELATAVAMMLLGLLRKSASLHDQSVLPLVQGGLEIVKLGADTIACQISDFRARAAVSQDGVFALVAVAKE